MNNQRNRKGKYAKVTSRKRLPLAVVILLDALLIGVILLTFATFHHVLPAMISEWERQAAMENAADPVPTGAPVHDVQEDNASASEDEQTIPEETVPDNRTEWQKKFADKFTDEVVKTANSYTSPEVSITLQTLSYGEGNKKVTYHVADIYVASLDNFVTHTANNEMRFFGTQDVLEMDAAANAILSLSGDFLTYQKGGFLMRNGQVYSQNDNLDSICVLFKDGTMETYEKKTYQIDELMKREPVQVWSFGPVLLDENGKARDWYSDVSTAVSYPNPRSAIGYYEPGHYVFILVDGRQNGYSKGMELPELARVFQELGCKVAYNLDGGGSAVMVYDHERYSVQSNGGDRNLGDILVIRDSYYTMEEPVEETVSETAAVETSGTEAPATTAEGEVTQ